VQRIIDSQPYRELYPDVRLATPPSPRGLSLPRRTIGLFELVGSRGSLRSAGVAQSIARLPAAGAIIDDPFGKREDADSSVIRQEIWDWYANDLCRPQMVGIEAEQFQELLVHEFLRQRPQFHTRRQMIEA
jgi:hypothetical protein